MFIKDSSADSDDRKKDDSSSPQNNMINDDYDKIKTQVEDLEANETFSSSSNSEFNELLYPDVELLYNDKYEPLSKVDTCINNSDESVITTAANVAVSSAQLEHDQHHTLNYHNKQNEQEHSRVCPIDLFFYSMAESTKNLPRIYQATIQRKVLEIVLQVEEEAHKNKNDI